MYSPEYYANEAHAALLRAENYSGDTRTALVTEALAQATLCLAAIQLEARG